MLNQKKDKLINFAKKFIEICEKENIWYSLDKNTLLGSIKHGGFIPWEQCFNVMITLKGYKTLNQFYFGNIVNSFIDKKYKSLIVSFVENNKNWNNDQPFINIRILIPTTTKKIQKFSSWFFRLKNYLFFRFDNIKHAIDDLYEKNKYEGFYLLEKRCKFNKKNWIQTLSMKRKEINFSKIKVKVLVEYDTILKNWYGENYLIISSVPSIWYNYVSPLLKKRVIENKINE